MGKTTFFFWPSKDKLVFLWSNTRCGAGLHLSTILYKKYISLNSRIILSSGSSHREALAEAETLRAEQSPISLASLTSVRDARAEALKGLKRPFKNPPAPLSWPRNLSLNFVSLRLCMKCLCCIPSLPHYFWSFQEASGYVWVATMCQALHYAICTDLSDRG